MDQVSKIIDKGEITGLKWVDVNLKNGIIRVEETKDESKINTGERRNIPIAPPLKQEFLKLAKNKRGEYIFHHSK